MKNYITPEGIEKLKSELKKLLTQERPEVVKAVSWAASNGDRSENADYIYGKRRLREIDRRIRFLTKRIESAEVVKTEDRGDLKRVLFGATVTVQDDEGKTWIYRIVGQDEVDPARGWVSWVSPVGKALLNMTVGDLVEIKIPKGIKEVEILEIK